MIRLLLQTGQFIKLDYILYYKYENYNCLTMLKKKTYIAIRQK